MGRDVLQGLESILDEPQARAPPVRGRVVVDKAAQVVALMCTGLLPLDVGESHLPVAQDLAGELPLFRRHEHRPLRLGHQATDLRYLAVRDVAPDPVAWVGGNPLTSDRVKRLRQRADEGVAVEWP